MTVRMANKFDIPRMLELGYNACLHRGHGSVASILNMDTETSWQDSPRKIFAQILAGAGLIFLYESNNKVEGILMAMRSPSMWDHTKYAMYNQAIWIEAGHRGDGAGNELIQAYIEACNKLKEEKQIMYYTMSIDADLQMDLSKVGFHKFEQVWAR